MAAKQEENKKISGKVFDYQLFAKLMKYVRHYQFQFVISFISVVSLGFEKLVNAVSGNELFAEGIGSGFF